MVNKKEKTYWPHVIVGFIMMGVTLGYWTIKSASFMPVQESNNLKYWPMSNQSIPHIY